MLGRQGKLEDVENVQRNMNVRYAARRLWIAATCVAIVGRFTAWVALKRSSVSFVQKPSDGVIALTIT